MDELTAHYERKFSDGAFGSEGVSLAITRDITPADATSDTFMEIIEALRHSVLESLAGSRSRNVARAARYELEPVLPAQPESTEDLEDLPFDD